MRWPLREFCFVLPPLEVEEMESWRGFVKFVGNEKDFFVVGWVAFVGTL